MSDVVEDEEEDGSTPLAAAACASSRMTCSGSLGFSGVGVLDKSV
jgi:hypothetical protein